MLIKNNDLAIPQVKFRKFQQ